MKQQNIIITVIITVMYLIITTIFTIEFIVIVAIIILVIAIVCENETLPCTNRITKLNEFRFTTRYKHCIPDPLDVTWNHDDA